MLINVEKCKNYKSMLDKLLLVIFLIILILFEQLFVVILEIGV
jgi:hypothetical protein